MTITDEMVEQMRQALDNSQSLLVAMLHEQRSEEEIEIQIVENRIALNRASFSTKEDATRR